MTVRVEGRMMLRIRSKRLKTNKSHGGSAREGPGTRMKMISASILGPSPPKNSLGCPISEPRQCLPKLKTHTITSHQPL